MAGFSRHLCARTMREDLQGPLRICPQNAKSVRNPCCYSSSRRRIIQYVGENKNSRCVILLRMLIRQGEAENTPHTKSPKEYKEKKGGKETSFQTVQGNFSLFVLIVVEP